jgi:hypothetical protein
MCRLFNEGRTDVHKEVLSGCLSVITEDFKYRVDASLSFPIFFFFFFPLQDCHISILNLCRMGSKNAHSWTQAKDMKEPITDCLNGLVADFYDRHHQACATSGQMPESQ